MYSIDFGNLYFAQAGIEHCLDMFLFPVQKPLARTFGSAKLHAFGFLPGEGFFGALADELAFYLGADAEGESQDFAGNVVAQAVAVFNSPYLGSDFHAAVQYGHDHKQASSQTADLRADDDVVFLHSFQKFAQPAFVYLLGAADGFADPFVYLKILFRTEFCNFESLIFYCLFVCTYPYISVYHNMCIYYTIIFFYFSSLKCGYASAI